MKTFELQTFNRNTWKIDSLFDDAEMALEEARRVEQSRRYYAVRVIEEVYDEETNRTTSRTVFRGGNMKQVRAPQAKKNAPSAAGPHYGVGREPVHRAAPAAMRKQESLLRPMLILLFSAIAALCALVGLHQLELLH